jgi:hypothetical protein
MSKLPTRDVQVFVAGAFALWGFRALIWLPSDFLAPIQSFVWFTRIGGAVVTGLALPLGVAILFGNRRALFLTKIYLWLVLIVGVLSAVSIYYDKLVIGVPLSWHAVMQITGGIAPDLLVCIVLLWFLCSRRFRQTPNNSLQATAAAPASCD